MSVRLSRRALVGVGAAATGAAAAALSPATSVLLWTALCAAGLAAVNGYGKTSTA
jgi:hypothetical protein